MHKLLSHWQYQRPAVSSRRMAAHLSLPRIQVAPASHLAGTQALGMSCWDTPGKPDIRVTDLYVSQCQGEGTRFPGALGRAGNPSDQYPSSHSIASRLMVPALRRTRHLFAV